LKQLSHWYIILSLTGSGKSKCIDIHSHKKDNRESAERQVGRGTAEISMEPQHFRLQSNKIHPFQVVVWGGAYNTKGNQILQRQNKGGDHL
jgi:hypothetical protein